MLGQRSRLAAVLTVAALAVTACGGAGGAEGSKGTAGNPAPVAGFDGKTINLGVLTPVTGPVAVLGEPVTAGNKVWFDHLNSEGGVAGKYKVKLVKADTQYKPDVAVQQYNKIKGDVVAFTQLLGTPPTTAVLPLLRTDKALAAPASLDATWVREPNLLPIGAPYQIQSINAVEHYLSEGGGSTRSKICAMTQDDAYGEAGLAGVEFAAEHHGFKLATVQKFKLGTENYTGQIQALRRAKCDMVFLTATPSDAGKIWGTAAQSKYAPKWYGQQPTFVAPLAKSPIGPYLKENVLIASDGTEWGDEKVTGMKDMVARAKKYAPKQQPDYYFPVGYNQARAMTAVLEKAVELGDLSRAGILKASEQLGKVSFDGLTGDYTYGPAAKRNPPRVTTLFSVDPDSPFGLATVTYSLTSKAADEYEFTKAT